MMADSKCSLPEAWKNGELTPDTISLRHEQLLPDVQDLENDLTDVGKSIEGYIDALNNFCNAGCRVSATFAKLLGDTTLSNISQQFQQVADKLEQTALNECSADISSNVLTTLNEFTATLPAVKQEIGDYKRCKNRHAKCQETLESFAQKDAAATEGKRFQTAKERFLSADKDYTKQQEQLSQCLSALEGNRIKMIGASLLSLLNTIAQFNGDMSTMMAPLGEYQSVGDYLRDGEIAPQLKESTTTWCSVAQSYQSVRENVYLSSEDIYNLLKHKKGEELSSSQKLKLAEHVRTLLQDYKNEVVSIDDGPVTIPGGFFKNPAGIRVALKGCCSGLESLAIDGINLCPSHNEIIATLQKEIPKVELAVASVGKPWHTIANLEGSDIVESRQHRLKDLVEPLAKIFDIPFTKESFMSFTLTVLNEACSEKTILASKIAVQLLYGKSDLVDVKLSPDSSRSRNIRLHCKEKGVNIEVHLTWWVTRDDSLFSGILEDDIQPLFEVKTIYSTMVDYMDYLEDKEFRLPSITVEYCSCAKQDKENSTELEEVSDVPVAPPRSKHYARKYAARKKKSELDSLISRSVKNGGVHNKTKSSRHGIGTASHLSLASETELSEVINFLSGMRPRGNPDDGDTESVCSTRALSDSGIESVNNAKLGLPAGAAGKLSGSGEIDEQTKGKKGKKKDKKAGAAAKGESFNKKKKKKRADRKKEKKKAAAEEQVNEKSEEGEKNDVGEVSQTIKEENAEECDQDAVKISESLRSVWEKGDKQQKEAESTPANSLTLQVPNIAEQSSKLYGSQDSVYFSCWSIPGLAHDADDSQSVAKTTSEEIVPSEYSVGGGWSKRYEQQGSASQRSIWSPALPSSAATVENLPRKESWPPSLKRQDVVDVGEVEPNSMVGESVFSLGLGITGFELFAAAKQAGSSNSRSSDGSERFEKRNVTFQSPMGQTSARSTFTAGQFSERSSSYGEGLHRQPQHEPLERVRLHTHHSDPFLSKNVPWSHGVPPMYMKVRYNPNLIAPYPGEELPGGYGSPQPGRGPRGYPKQGHSSVDRRRATPQFHVPPRAGPL